MNTIENTINPFELDQSEMVHITSGIIANDKVKNDLQNVKAIGEERLSVFVQTKLLSKEPDIFAAIQKTKLHTFSSLTKPVSTTKAKGKEISLKSSRNLMGKLLLLARSREIDLKEVLSFSLGPYPLSLATTDGNMVKTVKANLMHIIEDMVDDSVTDVIPSNGALIIDAMAMFQSLSQVPATFEELPPLLLSILISMATRLNATRVDFVVDRYPKVSIKNSERKKRAYTGSNMLKIYGKKKKTPTQWKKFLNNGENKESLACFVVDEWKESKSEHFRGVILYATRKDQCFKFLPSHNESEKPEFEQIHELHSDHEEADTRLLLHANHASTSGYTHVSVKSPDTDVFVLLVTKGNHLTSQMYFVTGNNSKSRIIDITKIARSLDDDICNSLIGLHAFTGLE